MVAFCECLAPLGASGLKYRSAGIACRPCCLAPLGASGLKCPWLASCPRCDPRLAPLGASGLKSGCSARSLLGSWSRPVRGEWIEIGSTPGETGPCTSRPVRGEWIEISKATASGPRNTGLAPLGASGLKLLAIVGVGVNGRLAPLGASGLKCVRVISQGHSGGLAPLGASGLK